MYFNIVKFTEKINTLFGEKTQTEIAEMLGISQTMVSALKNGKIQSPGADTVFKIALCFNVSTDYLLGLTDVQTTDRDLAFVCKYINQSQNMVDFLKENPRIDADMLQTYLKIEPHLKSILNEFEKRGKNG